MNAALIEVETESAGRYENVDQESLHRLVSQLGPKNSYLILHRGDKPDEFAQVAIEAGKSVKDQHSFLIEFKDESGAQFQTRTRNIDSALAALAGWAFDLPGWKKTAKWKRLKLNKVVDLSGHITYAQRDGIWTAHFPFLGVSASASDKDEAYRELITVAAETVNQGPKEKREAYSKFLSKNLIEISEDELKLRLERAKLSPEQQLRIAKSSGQWWADGESKQAD